MTNINWGHVVETTEFLFRDWRDHDFDDGHRPVLLAGRSQLSAMKEPDSRKRTERLRFWEEVIALAKQAQGDYKVSQKEI